MHATPTAKHFFLVLISASPADSPFFFVVVFFFSPNLLLLLNCVGFGLQSQALIYIYICLMFVLHWLGDRVLETRFINKFITIFDIPMKCGCAHPTTPGGRCHVTEQHTYPMPNFTVFNPPHTPHTPAPHTPAPLPPPHFCNQRLLLQRDLSSFFNKKKRKEQQWRS